MTITCGTNRTSRDSCAEFIPGFPCQFAAVALIQQNVKHVMRSHVRVLGHNANGTRISFLRMTRNSDAVDDSTAHINRVIFMLRMIFRCLNSEFQLLLIAGKTLPHQRAGCDHLANFTVQQNTLLRGVYRDNEALHNQQAYRYWYPHGSRLRCTLWMYVTLWITLPPHLRVFSRIICDSEKQTRNKQTD